MKHKRWSTLAVLGLLLAACSSPVAPMAESDLGNLPAESQAFAEAYLSDHLPGSEVKEVRVLSAADFAEAPDLYRAAGSFEMTVRSTGVSLPGSTDDFLASLGSLETAAPHVTGADFKNATYRALYGYRNTFSNLQNPADHTDWMRSSRVSLSDWDYTWEAKFYCNLFRTYCAMTSAWSKWAMTDRRSMVIAAWDGDLYTRAIHLEVLQLDKSGWGQAKVIFGSNDEVFVYKNPLFYRRYHLPLQKPTGQYLKGLTKTQKQANLRSVFAPGQLSTQAGLDALGFCISPKPGQHIPDPGNMACPLNPGDVDVQGCPNCTAEIDNYNRVDDALWKIENETIPDLNVDAGVTGASGLSCVGTIAGVITVVGAPWTCGAFAISLTNVTFQAVKIDVQQYRYNRQLKPLRDQMNNCVARQNQCKQPPVPGHLEPLEIALEPHD